MNITKHTIDTLKPVVKPTTFYDDALKGFGLRVFPPSAKSPRGARSWIIEYRPAGSGRAVAKKRLSLGSAEALDAKTARQRAKDMLAKVALGEDPATDRAEARASRTVAALAGEYMARPWPDRKASTLALYRTYWDHSILPIIGTMRARDVKPRDVENLMAKIAEDGRRVTANRCLTLLRHFFSWVATHEKGFGENPTKGLGKYKETAKDRFLSPEELKRLGDAIREAETVGIPWAEPKKASKHLAKPENRFSKIDASTAAAFKLLIYTGARLREILHLKWEHVDLSRGLLRLPDSKTGQKVIFLNQSALKVLADLEKTDEFVVSRLRPSKKPLAPGEVSKPRADLQRPWALLCRRAGLKDLRIHDLRHTFASVGAAGGLGLQSVGALLGHKDSSTTQRYSHLAAEPLRRAADFIGAEIEAALEGKAAGPRQ